MTKYVDSAGREYPGKGKPYIKRGPRKPKINFCMEQAMQDGIHGQCRKERISRSDFIRRAIKTELEKVA